MCYGQLLSYMLFMYQLIILSQDSYEVGVTNAPFHR